MKTLIKMSFKNILRNKRRSLMTAFTIFFGVFVITMASSYVEGLYNGMTESILLKGTGHIQIHFNGYMQSIEDRTTSENYYFDPTEILKEIENNIEVSNIQSINKRLTSLALIGNKCGNTSAYIMGIDIENENTLLNSLTVTDGIMLEQDDANQIIISERIARVLNVIPGDSISISTTGNEKQYNIQEYKIKGIFDSGIQFNGFSGTSEIYMDLKDCQIFLNSDNQISEIAIELTDSKLSNNVKTIIKNSFSSGLLDLEIHDWKYIGETLLDIASYIKIGISVWTGIISIVILFMISNTLIMNVYERTYEVGILKTIGMRNRKIKILFVLEAFILSVISVTTSFCFSLICVLVIRQLGLPGMFNFLFEGQKVYPSINFLQTSIFMLIAVLISTIAGLHPASQASKMTIIDAIKSE